MNKIRLLDCSGVPACTRSFEKVDNVVIDDINLDEHDAKVRAEAIDEFKSVLEGWFLTEGNSLTLIDVYRFAEQLKEIKT